MVIRSNLDPFGLYTDLSIWESLHRTQLSRAIHTLDDVVSENGSNYSVGQRQLLCIARALLGIYTLYVCCVCVYYMYILCMYTTCILTDLFLCTICINCSIYSTMHTLILYV